MHSKNIIGIVAEYNPFHRGHAYQIHTAKKELQAQGVIAIMSGNFTQRGEAALLDKWQRTELALAGGVDLVLELPAIYALRSSEIFGNNAIKLLAATGVVSHVVFGCETDTPSLLVQLAKEEITKASLKEYLDKGLTYGAAVTAFLTEKHPQAGTLLQKPNNILALSYYRALQGLTKGPIPHPLQRQGAGYKDSELTTEFPSAQALRQELRIRGLSAQVQAGIPEDCLPLLTALLKERKNLDCTALLYTLLKYRLYTATPQSICRDSDCSEGLENKLLAGIAAGSYEEFLQAVKSKRYPLTRIQRLTCQLLLSTSEVPFHTTATAEPAYLRVLGFTETGRSLLKTMKKTATLPLLTKLHKNELQNKPKDFQLSLQTDINATNLYDILIEQIPQGRDYLTSPLYYTKEGSHVSTLETE